MSAASIGSLLAGTATGAAAHVSAGIWRCSYDVEDSRAKVGRPFGDGSTAQSLAVIELIVETATAWRKTTRLPGKAHALTCNMIDTLSCILHLKDFATGNIEASYEMIMKATGLCRDTVHRHINALREFGWLDWVRRTIRTKKGFDATTASNYFFEISRLPLKAQILLRQKLKRKGIALASHPDRKGSGRVPNLAERMAERIARGCRSVRNKLTGERRNKALLNEAAFIQGEMAIFGDVPVDQWAALRHPGDLVAQQGYAKRLGLLPFCALPSPGGPIESPPEG